VKFAEYAKMYVALAGLIAAGVVGVPDIPLWAKLPLQVVIAVAGAFAVWKVENKDPEPPAPNWKSAGPAWDVMDVSTEADDDDKPQALYLLAA
jgi:hypothetical protein